MRYAVFETPAGWIAVLGTASGLKRLELPSASAEAALAALDIPPAAREDAAYFSDLITDLRRYFGGQAVNFTFPLDLAGAPPFRQRVWQATRGIPWGETRSYGWLAAQAGQPRGARAVGQAMAHNPVPIVVPCHRVVGTHGLGGFTGGLDMKRRLLALEGGARL
jgi:methylated-DNA-[protein]-cysteine S-methyltransferase